MAFNKDTGMYEGYIYCATNLINNKKYVGQTRITIEHRMKQHEIYHPKNQVRLAFHMAIKKYGIENFKVEELEKIITETKENLINRLNEREVYYIKTLHSLTTENGYNIDGGGKSGTIFCLPVDVYDLKGVYLRSFDSIIEASRYYNIPRGIINKMCLGQRRRSNIYDLIFRYKGDDFNKYETTIKLGNSKKVYQFALDGKFVNEYPSIVSAEREMTNNKNTKTSAINHVISKNKTAYGYIWSYDKNYNFDLQHYRNLTPVDKYSTDGKFLCSYISMRHALQDIEQNILSSASIRNVCSGTSLTAYGFVWRYKGEPFDKYRINPKDRSIPVNQYSIDDKFITSFHSAKIASIHINFKGGDSAIIKCCKGKQRTSCGYKWFYANDPNQPDKSKIIA